MTERTADSRWTDNPFQPPNASPELLEWYEKRDEAIRIWRETGDETMAIEIGLFPTPEEEAEVEREMAMGENFVVGVRECGTRLMEEAKLAEQREDGGEVLSRRVYKYEGEEFEVIRTSPDSATVTLDCEMHDHEVFIVGKIEGHREWGVGRKDSGSSFDGSFAEAVDHCADQLIEECNNIESIAEVDDFFDGEEIE